MDSVHGQVQEYAGRRSRADRRVDVKDVDAQERRRLQACRDTRRQARRRGDHLDETKIRRVLHASRAHQKALMASEPPIVARHSLRVRLPLLISALLIAVVATFLWVAHREVEGRAERAGGERAKGAADQVANLLERSSLTGMENLHRVAADAAVRRYVTSPTGRCAGTQRVRG